MPCIGALNWNVLNPSTYVSDTHYSKEFSFITEYCSVLASSHMQSSWYGYFKGPLNCFLSFAFFLFCLRIYSMVTNLGTGCQESWVLPFDGCPIRCNLHYSFELTCFKSFNLCQRTPFSKEFDIRHRTLLSDCLSTFVVFMFVIFDLSLIPHLCLCKWVVERHITTH